MTKNLKLKTLLTTCLLTVLLTVGVMAQHQGGNLRFEPWTANGSTGTVDETSYDLVRYVGGTVYLSDFAPAQTTAAIRYNITATTGLSRNGATLFRARVLDNGAHARVILYLRSYELETGITRTLATLDSDNLPQLGRFQVATLSGCNVAALGGFQVGDFSRYSYYIEAHLIRTGWQGAPGLGILQLDNPPIACPL